MFQLGTKVFPGIPLNTLKPDLRRRLTWAFVLGLQRNGRKARHGLRRSDVTEEFLCFVAKLSPFFDR